MRTIPANFRTKAEDYYYRVNKADVAVAVMTAVGVLAMTGFIGPFALGWIAAQAAG
jgi:hypothetical protein